MSYSPNKTTFMHLFILYSLIILFLLLPSSLSSSTKTHPPHPSHPKSIINSPKNNQHFATSSSSSFSPIIISISTNIHQLQEQHNPLNQSPNNHHHLSNHNKSSFSFSSSSQLSLCIELHNKRHSWNLQIECSNDYPHYHSLSSLELDHRDLPEGVYSLRSYFINGSSINDFPISTRKYVHHSPRNTFIS